MDFAALILFLTFYYIRPHEWIMVIQPLRPVTLVMIFAIFAVMSRPGGFSRKELLRTPHDWLVVIYCLWMVFTASDMLGTFHSVYPLYLCYAVAVQALYSIERIRRFLFWWAMMIFALTAFAVSSEYGFDPTGAYDITHGSMKDRLVINTSLFNNPNALGHTCVPVVLMLYFLLVWKRPIFARIGSIPLFALPLYCIYLTVSKGSFISGFASIVTSLTFRRHKVTQIIIVVLAITMGWGAVKMLPRMKEIERTKTDGAIQGRVAAWRFGLQKVESTITGIGKDNFVQDMMDSTGIRKSAHSSYVQIGTELGRVGLFLFLFILYCCLRTLFTSQPRNVNEERVQRILFSMIISFMVSSWMVDFAYRTNLFLLFASIAAYHRLLLKQEDKSQSEDVTVQESLSAIPSLTIGGLGPQPAMAVPTNIAQRITQTTISVPVGDQSEDNAPDDDEKPPEAPGLTWNRIGWFDVVCGIVMTLAAIRVWRYAVGNV